MQLRPTRRKAALPAGHDGPSLMMGLGLGVLVGVIMALTGAGGGILAVPLLIFGLGISVSQAAPIGLLAVGMAAALGAALGLKEGIVRYKAATLMAGTGIILAPIGVWGAHHADNRWMSLLFACVMLWVAFRTYRRAGSQSVGASDTGCGPPCMINQQTGRFAWTWRCARALSSSGALAGLLSGLLGVGGGFVMVPVLKCFTDLPMQSIIATSLAVIALVSVSAVTAGAMAGTIDWSVAWPFASGALAGMLVGRRVATRVAGPQLQRGFAVVAAVVALGLIIKAL